MDLHIHFTKRVLVYFGLVFIVFGIGAGIAFSTTGTGGTPSSMGHSVDEIDWTKSIPGDINMGKHSIANVRGIGAVSDDNFDIAYDQDNDVYFKSYADAGKVIIGSSSPVGVPLIVLGKIGIGQGSPMEAIHIGSYTYGQEAMIRFHTGNGVQNRMWDIGVPGGGSDVTGASYDFAIRDQNGNYPFDIDFGTGNVGIGTITPSEKLEVGGNVRVAGNIKVNEYVEVDSGKLILNKATAPITKGAECSEEGALVYSAEGTLTGALFLCTATSSYCPPSSICSSESNTVFRWKKVSVYSY